MQDTGREGSALRSPAAWARYLAIIVAGAALDLWTKHWAGFALDNRDTRWTNGRLTDLQARFWHTLEFIWQPNRGAVLGVGQGQTRLFIAFTFLALALLTWLFIDSRRRQAGLQIFLACVVAGAIGNLYDRMRFGHVRDFLRFSWRAEWADRWGGDAGYVWPYVFNIADVFITIGVVGLFIVWLHAVIKHRRDKARAAATAG